MEKTAVDSKTSEYWTKYFGSYGKTFVRTIPRRIKAMLERTMKTSSLEGNVAPLASNVSKDDTLSVEAAFKGTIDGKETTILVTAEFSEEGKLKKFESCQLV
jgi:hypothetical protein